jgi:hypothetical protein
VFDNVSRDATHLRDTKIDATTLRDWVGPEYEMQLGGCAFGPGQGLGSRPSRGSSLGVLGKGVGWRGEGKWGEKARG